MYWHMHPSVYITGYYARYHVTCHVQRGACSTQAVTLVRGQGLYLVQYLRRLITIKEHAKLHEPPSRYRIPWNRVVSHRIASQSSVYRGDVPSRCATCVFEKQSHNTPIALVPETAFNDPWCSGNLRRSLIANSMTECEGPWCDSTSLWTWRHRYSEHKTQRMRENVVSGIRVENTRGGSNPMRIAPVCTHECFHKYAAKTSECAAGNSVELITPTAYDSIYTR